MNDRPYSFTVDANEEEALNIFKTMCEENGFIIKTIPQVSIGLFGTTVAAMINEGLESK